MSKVTPETVTPEHVKAARALLSWSGSDLAKKAGVSAVTLRRWESGKSVRGDNVKAIYETLEAAGVEFMNGGRPGVRLSNGGMCTDE